jgi:hypothetical protein
MQEDEGARVLRGQFPVNAGPADDGGDTFHADMSLPKDTD